MLSLQRQHSKSFRFYSPSPIRSRSRIYCVLSSLVVLVLLSAQWREGGAAKPFSPQVSLSSAQHLKLASHIQSTLDLPASSTQEGALDEERRCLTKLAREVVVIATRFVTPPVSVSSSLSELLSSRDEGISSKQAEQILETIVHKIHLIQLPSSCTTTLPREEQQEAAKRMALVLSKSMMKGRFLSLGEIDHVFLLDVIKSLFGEEYSQVGFTVTLGLSMLGFFLLLDTFVLKLLPLGRKERKGKKGRGKEEEEEEEERLDEKWRMSSNKGEREQEPFDLIEKQEGQEEEEEEVESYSSCSCQICLEKLDILSLLGQGGFSRVYMVRHKFPSSSSSSSKSLKKRKPFILKVLPVMENFDQLQAGLEEAKTLILLSHPYIVHYKDMFVHYGGIRNNTIVNLVYLLKDKNETEDDDQDTSNDNHLVFSPPSCPLFVCLAMEYCLEGNLDELLSSFDSPHRCLKKGWTLEEKKGEEDLFSFFPFSWLCTVLYQISLALDHLHSVHHLIHSDIKCENIFIQRVFVPSDENEEKREERIVFKLGDFGLVVKEEEEEDENEEPNFPTVSIIGGTLPYQAPEATESDDEEEDEEEEQEEFKSSSSSSSSFSSSSSSSQHQTRKTPLPQLFYNLSTPSELRKKEEEWQTFRVTRQIDSWALGCVLYEVRLFSSLLISFLFFKYILFLYISSFSFY